MSYVFLNLKSGGAIIEMGITSLRSDDFNSDNAIDILNIGTIISKFGQSGFPGRSAAADCGNPDEPSDINDDGNVNIGDLAITAGNWGKTGPTPWQP